MAWCPQLTLCVFCAHVTKYFQILSTESIIFTLYHWRCTLDTPAEESRLLFQLLKKTLRDSDFQESLDYQKVHNPHPRRAGCGSANRAGAQAVLENAIRQAVSRYSHAKGLDGHDRVLVGLGQHRWNLPSAVLGGVA